MCKNRKKLAKAEKGWQKWANADKKGKNQPKAGARGHECENKISKNIQSWTKAVKGEKTGKMANLGGKTAKTGENEKKMGNTCETGKNVQNVQKQAKIYINRPNGQKQAI